MRNQRLRLADWGGMAHSLRTRVPLREGALGILVDPRRPDEIQAGVLKALQQPPGVIPAGLDYFSFENFEKRCHRILRQVIKSKDVGCSRL